LNSLKNFFKVFPLSPVRVAGLKQNTELTLELAEEFFQSISPFSR